MILREKKTLPPPPPLADAFIENASLCFLKIGQTYCEYNVRKDLKNIFT